MGEVLRGSPPIRPNLDEPVGARAMCVWLGTLASWRPGLIGRLVREYRSAGALLERPPGEIVAFAARRERDDRRRGSQEGEGRTSGAKAPARTPTGSPPCCAQARRRA